MNQATVIDCRHTRGAQMKRKITTLDDFFTWAKNNGISTGSYNIPCLVADPVDKSLTKVQEATLLDHHYSFSPKDFYNIGYEDLDPSCLLPPDQRYQADLDLIAKQNYLAWKARWKV